MMVHWKRHCEHLFQIYNILIVILIDIHICIYKYLPICPTYRSAYFQLITLSQSKTTKLNNCVLVECSNSHSRHIVEPTHSASIAAMAHMSGQLYSFSSNAYNYVNCTMNMQNTTYVRVIMYIYVPWKSWCRKILHSYNGCRKPHHHFVLFKNKNFYSTGCT